MQQKQELADEFRSNLSFAQPAKLLESSELNDHTLISFLTKAGEALTAIVKIVPEATEGGEYFRFSVFFGDSAFNYFFIIGS